MEEDKQQEIKGAVMRLLARREYCRQEIEQKYARKYPASDLEQALDDMEEAGYLSDDRFVEVFVRNKVSQCYGLKRISFDLKQKKIPEHLLCKVLDEQAPDWFELAREAWERRFREPPAGDYKVFGKQMRYLLQRGFSMDEARAAIDYKGEHDE